MESRVSPQSWWGTFELPDGEVRRWRVGPTTLWIQRLRGEWRVLHEHEDDPLATPLEIATPVESDALPTANPPERFVDADAHSIRLLPTTADRAIVTRPQSPFHILPERDVTLYVSSPLWMRLQSEPSGDALCEFPIHRPSDTWIGSSTREGEVGYATVTHCRLELDDVPQRPHRAVTRVRIRNRSSQALHLQRLSVPVPFLSLFAGRRGLWTDAIALTREGNDGELADLEVEKLPPECEAGEQVAVARQPREAGVLVRAFGALF
jgi:hypothetical protein